jgi:hypothetical protein
LERLGSDVNALTFFELEELRDRYRQMDGAKAPFKPGKWHNHLHYTRMHQDLVNRTDLDDPGRVS